jgi:hypothetical protein
MTTYEFVVVIALSIIFSGLITFWLCAADKLKKERRRLKESKESEALLSKQLANEIKYLDFVVGDLGISRHWVKHPNAAEMPPQIDIRATGEWVWVDKEGNVITRDRKLTWAHIAKHYFGIEPRKPEQMGQEWV